MMELTVLSLAKVWVICGVISALLVGLSEGVLTLGVICASIVLGPILLSTLAAISVFTLLEVLGEVVLWRRK